MPLTQNELSAIKIQLEVERELLQRYDEYILACPNVELKRNCEKLASRHKNHYNELLQMLK